MGFSFVDIVVILIIFVLTVFVFRSPLYFVILFAIYLIFRKITFRETEAQP